MKFSCQFNDCAYKSINYKWLMQHMWNFHSMQRDFSVKCNISGCASKFINQKNFRGHIGAKHKKFNDKFLREYVGKEVNIPLDFDEIIPTSNDLQEEPIVDDIYSSESDNDEEFFEPFQSIDVDDIVADVLVELREIHNVTQSAISVICNKIVGILQTDRYSQRQKLQRSLKDNHPALVVDYETKMILESESPFKRPFQRFSNGQTLNTYIAQKAEYVAPCEIPLGFDPQTEKKECVYYVPILKTLEKYLCHDDVLGDIVNPHMTQSDTLEDFKDGINFGKNHLFSSYPNALQIVFYHDDFQVSNPLGNKTVKFKISGFYYIVGNVRPEHRSRLKDLHLAILCKASLVKTFSYKSILDPLLTDLKLLETSGIEILFHNSTHHFFGTISMLVADNLAAHAIGGYYQNFSTVQRFCRFCNRVKDLISDHSCIDVVRTQEAYDAQVMEVEKAPELSQLYGIKERSVLNELDYFHITDGAPGDLAHDVFEGFAVELLGDIVIYMVKNKKVTLSELNDRIANLEYAEVHKRNKPQPIKEKSLTQLRIKQTACEMWNLITLFPLIVGDLMEPDNETWKLFLLFHDIVQRLCAHRFKEDDLLDLESLLKIFFEEYLKVFPQNKLKPKAHFLLHYPMNIRKFGPLITTLRFESKHSYFKNSIVSSKNRVNVCKSMSTHHQMLMYLSYKKDMYFSSEDSILTGAKEVSLDNLPEYLKNLILGRCNLLSNTFMEGTSVCHNGQRYSCGCAVLLTTRDGKYVFGEVVSVFVINDMPHLFCAELDTVELDSHINGYVTLRSDRNIFIKISELADYHPLGIYNVRSKQYIILRHFVHV